MPSCQCQGIEREFNARCARKDLRRLRKDGPSRTTRLLIDAIRSEGVTDASMIDIGGGVGAITFALLAAGARCATSVDASSAYDQVARGEAKRRGVADRITFVHGDFTEVAEVIPEADIVTLDRVICCYDDMQQLVDASARRAGRLYGLVYPRDTWWTRFGSRFGNLYLRLTGSPLRTFVHPAAEVALRIRSNGLEPVFQHQTQWWQVAVYRRRSNVGAYPMR